MLIEEKLTKQELFTTTEKRIVDYIRRNIEAAVYMTIEELAKLRILPIQLSFVYAKKWDSADLKNSVSSWGGKFIN